MFRTSGYLAIALSIAAIGSAATPAAAFSLRYSGGANSASGASTKLKPIEVPAGQLPRPQVVPTVRPSRCAVTNCLVPSGNRVGG
jgi:hypothetical protein